MPDSNRISEDQTMTSTLQAQDSIVLRTCDTQYKIFLPNATTDYIQGKIRAERVPYELGMLKDMKSRIAPGSLVLDVGANIGNHSLYLAVVAGCKVMAFEPNKCLTNALRESIATNKLTTLVELHSIGLGKERCKGEFQEELPENLGGQSLSPGSGSIQILPMDSIKFSQPVCAIKVDVEGMELDVLQGGESVLKRDRPLLYVECQTEDNFRSISNWLVDLNYCYWDTFNATPTHLFVPAESIDLKEQITCLQFKQVMGDYRSNLLLSETRAKLDTANQKYHDSQKRIAILKEKISQFDKIATDTSRSLEDFRTQLEEKKLKLQREEKHRRNAENELLEKTQKLRKIESEPALNIDSLRLKSDTLKKELSNAIADRAKAEQRLIETRASIPYQFGYQVKLAVSSAKAFALLPLSLGRLVLSWRAQRRIIRQNEKAYQSCAAVPARKIIRPKLVKRMIAPPPPRKLNELQAQALIKHCEAKTLRVACIMDEFTFHSFEPECCLQQLTPVNWEKEVMDFNAEILFVESAWRGKDELWGTKVGHNGGELQSIVSWCRSQSIPTVFWNKEDPVHFQTFLNTAQQFDFVFTTDIDCIGRYKALLGHNRVFLLHFACQPKIHNPLEVYQRRDAISFAGAYYIRYPERTKALESFIDTLTGFRPLEIFDRNHGKEDPNYMFPPEYQQYIVGTLPPDKIDQAYKGYNYAINLNSINQSQTMFARRIFELLASNTITISNFSRGLRNLFGNLVLTSDNGSEILKKLQDMADDHEVARKVRLAALRKVMLEHTYMHRLSYICTKVAGKGDGFVDLPSVKVVARVNNQQEADKIIQQFTAQNLINKSLELFAAGRNILAEDVDVRILQDDQAEKLSFSAVVGDSDWIACFSTKDYYGSNYLLDLLIATRYSSAKVIGKASFYEMTDQGIDVVNHDMSYKPAKNLAIRRAIVSSGLLAQENLVQWATQIETNYVENDSALSTDAFNYCANVDSTDLRGVSRRVDDISGLDTGMHIHDLQKMAEDTPASTSTTDEAMINPAQLVEYFRNSRSKNVAVNVSDDGLFLCSTLAEGRHEYIYATTDLNPKELSSTRTLKFFLDSSPGFSVGLVAQFLDAQKQRIDHSIMQANRNETTEIPPATGWVRLGLRILGAGEATIKGIVLGHRDLQPPKPIVRAEHLVLTNHYPSYENLYRNGFVHARTKAYAEKGIKVDVFRLRADQPLCFEEFESVDVLTGDKTVLHQLLASGKYKNVLVHFLDSDMWDVLEAHGKDINIIVWVHGAEVQPLSRREYNYVSESDRAIAQIQSDQRIGFWRDVLQPMPKNLRLVFVSRHFAEEVVADIDVDIPDEQMSVIHNPIDTDLFSFQIKPVEQRKKILSIRPYASAKYANDLSVQAIQMLAEKPWFHELEFRLLGDGPLFDEILEPVKGYPNVHIERGFLRQSEIADLHKNYGVFLVPTRMDSQGVSRDEAMASGLVPVTNKVAAIPEFTDENCAILAPAEDASAIADGIQRLYNQPDTFLAMSAAAAKHVRQSRSKAEITEKELSLFVHPAASETDVDRKTAIK